MNKNDLNQSEEKKKGCGTYFLYFIGAIVVLSVLANIFSDEPSTRTENNNTTIESSSYTKVGQPLKTDMFEITANGVDVKDRVNTGNMFSDLKAEPGIKYLIINATFKNIDTESRMILDGSLLINYQGKDYQFDNSETIMAEGFGTMMDQLNPLTSKTTNLVYKIPAELTGDIFWQPGRSYGDDEVILLGTLE